MSTNDGVAALLRRAKSERFPFRDRPAMGTHKWWAPFLVVVVVVVMMMATHESAGTLPSCAFAPLALLQRCIFWSHATARMPMPNEVQRAVRSCVCVCVDEADI